ELRHRLVRAASIRVTLFRPGAEGDLDRLPVHEDAVIQVEHHPPVSGALLSRGRRRWRRQLCKTVERLRHHRPTAVALDGDHRLDDDPDGPAVASYSDEHVLRDSV